MSGFTGSQLSLVEEALNVRYQQLIDEVKNELENAGEYQYGEIIARDPLDIGDVSVGDALADLNVAMIDRQIHEIRDIEDARKRMKGGEFGACISCGAEIAFERLLASPTAKRCIQCQQQHDKIYAVERTPSL